MARFRFHRGGLADSMNTEIVVTSIQDIISAIYEGTDVFGERITPADLSIIPYAGDDPRIGWRDIHVVSAKVHGVIGFVEGDLA